MSASASPASDLTKSNMHVIDVLSVPNRLVAGRLVANSAELNSLSVNGQTVTGNSTPFELLIAQNLQSGGGNTQGQLLPPGSVITVLFPFQEIINTGNSFNTATGTYTVASTGTYKVIFNATFRNNDTANAASATGYILLNGAVAASSTVAVGANSGPSANNSANTPISLSPRVLTSGTTIQTAGSTTGSNVRMQNVLFSVSKG